MDRGVKLLQVRGEAGRFSNTIKCRLQLLGALTVSNVKTAAKPGQAASQHDGAGGKVNPADLAAFADNLHLIAIGDVFSRLAIQATLPDDLPHVRMSYVPKIHIQQLRTGITGDGLGGRIHVNEPIAFINEDGGSRRLSHDAELGFALPQPCFCFPAFTNVAINSIECRLARRKDDWSN
jgi:hypothetical protein